MRANAPGSRICHVIQENLLKFNGKLSASLGSLQDYNRADNWFWLLGFSSNQLCEENNWYNWRKYAALWYRLSSITGVCTLDSVTYTDIKQIWNIIYIYIDRLIGLVVSMSDYWSWGRGFDPRHFHNFKCGLGLERGPPSLVRTIG